MKLQTLPHDGLETIKTKTDTVKGIYILLEKRQNIIDDLKSWTKGCREIHEIKQNGFFYGLFTANFSRRFTESRQNLAFGWTAVYTTSNPSISGSFLKFPNFLRS